MFNPHPYSAEDEEPVDVSIPDQILKDYEVSAVQVEHISSTPRVEESTLLSQLLESTVLSKPLV